LVAIARRQPATRRDLEALRDFNRPQLFGKAHEILAAIAEARAVPAEDLPEPAERRDEPPGQAMIVSLLSATLSRACAQGKVAVGLAGGSNDLKDLIRWHLEGQPEGQTPDFLNGWRAEICGNTLLDVLTGRRALRIVDPGAEIPVALDAVTQA
jgi:ribonuclease D